MSEDKDIEQLRRLYAGVGFDIMEYVPIEEIPSRSDVHRQRWSELFTFLRPDKALVIWCMNKEVRIKLINKIRQHYHAIVLVNNPDAPALHCVARDDAIYLWVDDFPCCLSNKNIYELLKEILGRDMFDGLLNSQPGKLRDTARILFETVKDLWGEEKREKKRGWFGFLRR